MDKKKEIALTIAGSDPSTGAGLQADLKSFSYLGIHGTTVITCVTAQNTQQVKKIYKLPVEIIENQIDVLYEDIHPDAVKTGMLYDEEIVKCVAKKISQYNIKPVVDPIMVATSGDTLSQNNFVKAVKKELLQKTYMLTANLPEACRLLGKNIKSIDEIKKACKALYEMGPKYVLIKGGHLDTEDASDILFDGRKTQVFSLPRILDKKAHGSGCTLSAIVTGLLALGETPVEAVRKAKYIVWNMINEGYKPGQGADLPDHHPNIQIDIPTTFLSREHFKVWLELKTAVEKLVSSLPIDYIPEVGINVGYALPYAKRLEDICAIDGRIVKTRNKALRHDGFDFGVSKHIASIILTAMSFDPAVRCALNICYSKNNLELCKKAGFNIGSFDREKEPTDAKSTMEWSTKQVIKKLGMVPDIIYDTGSIGKEPMIRVLGKNPKDVVTKIQRLLRQENITKCL